MKEPPFRATDGFLLAEEDLKMRGSGEIFGTRQSGIPEFQVADIVRRLSDFRRSPEGCQQITADRTDGQILVGMIYLHLDNEIT